MLLPDNAGSQLDAGDAAIRQQVSRTDFFRQMRQLDRFRQQVPLLQNAVGQMLAVHTFRLQMV
ncbi:hypothetical protein D3C86_2173520 [compost metagenome]